MPLERSRLKALLRIKKNLRFAVVHDRRMHPIDSLKGFIIVLGRLIGRPIFFLYAYGIICNRMNRRNLFRALLKLIALSVVGKLAVGLFTVYLFSSEVLSTPINPTRSILSFLANMAAAMSSS